jgi:DNA mismatch repair protein MutL
MAVIFLTTPYSEVDVNVHPAKTEIRFRRPDQVFGAVQRAVRRELVADSPRTDGEHFTSLTSHSWSQPLGRSSSSGWDQPDTWAGHAALSGGRDHQAPGIAAGAEHASGGLNTAANLNLPGLGFGREGSDQLPVMRVVGQVGAAYIIAEGPDGLYLIDQHAAHERILYERFMSEWSSEVQPSIATQALISGQAVELTPAQMTLLEDHMDLLRQIGFDIEPFGPKTIMVRGVPGLITDLDPAQALIEVVDELEQGAEPLKENREAKIILRVCKSAAVKAGHILSQVEMEAMIRQLEACQTPLTCPHGRPTTILLSVSQLARQFGRT